MGRYTPHLVIAIIIVIIAVIIAMTFKGEPAPDFNQVAPTVEEPTPEPIAPTLELPTQILPEEPEEVIVTIKDFEFDPPGMIITKGTTVTWVYPEGTNQHVVIINEINARSGFLKAGDSWSYTFEDTGKFMYIDGVFEFMHGTVRVD